LKASTPILALDLGGTKCAGAIVESGLIIEKQVMPIAGAAGDAVFDIICSLISDLAGQTGKQSISGIGISVPGISNDDGTVWAPNIGGWDKFPLKQKLHQETGWPVSITSDRIAAILGETWMGNATGLNDAIYVAVGTGIGAGIIAGGRILDGAHNIAGAIGWLAIDDEYKEGYETFGCFEYNASGDGLSRTAYDYLKKGVSTSIPNQRPSSADIIEYYDRSDPLSVHVIDHAIKYWGRAVANLISIFNPEAIILGGGLFGPAVRFIPEISKEAEKWAQPIAFKKCKLLASKLGNDALLYGAAKLVLNES
jgi:glucokinase